MVISCMVNTGMNLGALSWRGGAHPTKSARYVCTIFPLPQKSVRYTRAIFPLLKQKSVL